MPQVLIALPDVYESVIRRCAIDSVNQLAQTMRLPPNTHILLPGAAEALPMDGGNVFTPCESPGIRYPQDGRLVVNFTEEVDESTTLSQHVGTDENLPLFSDPTRQLIMYPVYRSVTMTLNIEYTAPSQIVVQRWVDEMRARIVQLRAELYQSFEYHYAIPDSLMVLIHHVWEKIEASAQPLGLTFPEYLEGHLGRPTKTGETLAGTHPKRLVVERQHEVIGWFDFTSTPTTPQASSQGDGSFTASFSYSFIYDRPTQVLCRYPLVVHNQAIGSDYIPKSSLTTFRQVDRRVSFIKGNLESFISAIATQHIPYLVYPDMDDWSPSTLGSHDLIFFSGLLMVDQHDPRRLVDLAALGPHTFTPYFLEYFYQQRHTLFVPRKSPFVFTLYENQSARTDVTLSFRDGSLVIETDIPLDLRGVYHLQIGLVRDWGTLYSDTIQCLRRYPVVTYTLLAILRVQLGKVPYRKLRLLGLGAKRRPSDDCPGQGSIINPPSDGGTWPWPWLDDEDYVNDPWPGYDDNYDDHTWPGGKGPDYGDGYTWPPAPDDYIDVPSWGHDPDAPGNGSGVIRDDDIQDAVKETEKLPYAGLPEGAIGPLVIMYLYLMTFNGRA